MNINEFLKNKICKELNEDNLSEDKFLKNNIVILADKNNKMYVAVSKKFVESKKMVNYITKCYSIGKQNDDLVFAHFADAHYTVSPTSVMVELLDVKNTKNPCDAELLLLKAIEFLSVAKTPHQKVITGYLSEYDNNAKAEQKFYESNYNLTVDDNGNKKFNKVVNKSYQDHFIANGLNIVIQLEPEENGFC